MVKADSEIDATHTYQFPGNATIYLVIDFKSDQTKFMLEFRRSTLVVTEEIVEEKAPEAPSVVGLFGLKVKSE